MALKQQIDNDLKQAMLSGDKTLATTLRGLKSTILYAELAKNQRESGLSDYDIIVELTKEAKKRQESADLYEKGGDATRRDAELSEKKVIEKYLPKQLDEAEIIKLVDDVISNIGSASQQNMGQIIGAVKAKAGPTADGGVIARIVKEKIS